MPSYRELQITGCVSLRIVNCRIPFAFANFSDYQFSIREKCNKFRYVTQRPVASRAHIFLLFPVNKEFNIFNDFIPFYVSPRHGVDTSGGFSSEELS